MQALPFSNSSRSLFLAAIVSASVFPVQATVYFPPPQQVDLLIPPSGTGGSNSFPTISQLPVPLSIYETITDVNVRVTLAHTFDGDLIISLTAPDGRVFLLANRQ